MYPAKMSELKETPAAIYSCSKMRRKLTERCATEILSVRFGDAAAFSFYANKIITTGEGGMFVTDDDALAESRAAFALSGYGPESAVLAHDCRIQLLMMNLPAAIGLAQLGKK